MLKGLTIKLEEPICRCKVRNLGWGLDADKNGAYMYICCKSCHTTLCTRRIQAVLELDREYPEGRKKNVFEIVK